MDVPSIEAIKLTKHYGSIAALTDVSFIIRKGEVVGLLGPNGAGKSTLMRITSGLISASSGSVFVAGLSATRHQDKLKSCIGYMPENNPLPEMMKVQEYLKFRAQLKEVPHREIRRRVDEIMDVCDLRNKAAKRLIGKLSKGFRQRVGIADTLLSQPEVVIMDEPTIGLDPHQIRAVRKLIDRMRGNMTVILSSHILHEIDACCDRSMIINRGRIVASGTLSQMRKRYDLGVRYHLQAKGDLKKLDEILIGISPVLERIKTEPSDEEGFHSVVIDSQVNDDFGGMIIRKVLDCPDITIRECYRRESDLEDVFLAATKRSWEATMNEPKANRYSRLPVES